MNPKINYPIVALALLMPWAASQAEGTAGFVAGLEPSQRPAGAPVIEHFEQTEAWKANALKGIAQPQTGVGFLKDQGAWYTPFNHPNLLGRYDIRGLHDADKDKKRD